MGKKHKIPTRESLMKNLKKLSAGLHNCNCCQIKTLPCCTCGPSPCFNSGSCGRTCFLVPNFSISRSCSSTRLVNTCGPFPPSCADMFSCNLCNCCCQNPRIGLAKNCQGQRCNSCCQPRCFCNIWKYPCRPNQCNRYCMPTFQCFSRCCKRGSCYHKNHCRKSPPCSIKFRNCPAGNLCCRCKTICLPRCFSDTILINGNMKRKPLRCSKSVELRGGILYRGCDCDKRNGLQDFCLRYCCINNPMCELNPARCHCSKFSCGKHLAKRYSRRKHHFSYTCYVCEPPKYFTPFMPCYPVMNKCCCRKQTQQCKKEDLGCQCCPSMQETQCFCCLEEQCVPKKSSAPHLKMCCANTSPCPSPCISPCVSPCPSPCSVACHPSCVACYSPSHKEQFCSCCSTSCQHSSPMEYYANSNSCCCMCGQRECICRNHSQCDSQLPSPCISWSSPCQNVCNCYQ